jgi:hypothetical protein
MKFDNLSQNRINARQPLLARHQMSHTRISRRKFIAATAGASVLGAGLFRPLSALAAPGIGDLLPVPNTLHVFGVDIHVQVPPKTGANTDPATVWNFQGYSGIGLINTTATQTNRKTGAVRENLDSHGNHMTFLQGVYQGRDGHVREGVFALV